MDGLIALAVASYVSKLADAAKKTLAVGTHTVPDCVVSLAIKGGTVTKAASVEALDTASVLCIDVCLGMLAMSGITRERAATLASEIVAMRKGDGLTPEIEAKLAGFRSLFAEIADGLPRQQKSGATKVACPVEMIVLPLANAA